MELLKNSFHQYFSDLLKIQSPFWLSVSICLQSLRQLEYFQHFKAFSSTFQCLWHASVVFEKWYCTAEAPHSWRSSDLDDYHD